MKQFVIIGLGKFATRMIEELADSGCELLIVDRDADAVDRYKDRVGASYVADAINEEVISRLVPATIDAAILDLGDNIEAAILATNSLKKIGVRRIIAKVESDQHAEILDIVGATDIIRANLEAARRVAPLLLSSMLFSFLPIGRDFAIAEIKVPEKYVGKTLIEANLRQVHHMNVIALKKDASADYTYFLPEYRLAAEDVLLVAGKEDDIAAFARVELPAAREGAPGVFSRLFSRFRGSGSGGGTRR